jgi:SsrA-binding protein
VAQSNEINLKSQEFCFGLTFIFFNCIFHLIKIKRLSPFDNVISKHQEIMAEKIITNNRKARHDYNIIETVEAGIVLRGTEVKSMRVGKVNLKDSYATFKNGELFLIGMHVSPYEFGNIFNHDPERERKLLLHHKEIKRLIGKVQTQGMTLVPLKLYFKQGNVKVELALASGKKLYDRRHDIAKRDADREIQRVMKDKQFLKKSF